MVIIAAHTRCCSRGTGFLTGQGRSGRGRGGESCCKAAEGEPPALVLHHRAASVTRWTSAAARDADPQPVPARSAAPCPFFARAELPEAGLHPAGAAAESSAARRGAFVWWLLCGCFFHAVLSHLGVGVEQPCAGTKHSFAGIAAVTPGSALPA